MTQTENESRKETQTTSDPTFRNYKPSAAAAYAAYRQNYPPKFIKTIIDKHTSTGGQLNTVLDIGCGPGTATAQLAPFFQTAIGADPGSSMIEVARSMLCTTASGSAVRFEVCGAEDLASLVPAESVDLITAATCAHWFDMPRFYAAAAPILKPGGSIAIFGGGDMFAIPETTPNYEKLYALWEHFLRVTLAPYELPGNRLARELYAGLPLPWTISSPNQAFSPTDSMRLEFNADNLPIDDPDLAATKGYLKMGRLTIAAISKMITTISPVTRWREAHQEMVEKGEIRDCVEELIEKTNVLMKEGETEEGRDWLEVAGSMVLILIKKKREGEM